MFLHSHHCVHVVCAGVQRAGVPQAASVPGGVHHLRTEEKLGELFINQDVCLGNECLGDFPPPPKVLFLPYTQLSPHELGGGNLWLRLWQCSSEIKLSKMFLLRTSIPLPPLPSSAALRCASVLSGPCGRATPPVSAGP